MIKNITAKFFLQLQSRNVYCLAALIVSLMMASLQSVAQMTTISVPGQTNARSMLVYAPSGIQKNRPLLISLHGLNQDIAYQQGMAHWEQVADTAKFVVVYPQGESNSWDISGMKDINFILAIIESMVTRFDIDRSRVYLSGFSMGGMLTYHAASNIADKIAAFGPVSCMLFNSIYTNSRPIPFIQTHGDADDVFPYNTTLFNYWAGWRTKLKCPTTAVITKPTTGVTVSTWSPCDCNTQYVLVTLAGKGHEHSNTANYNTSVGIWNFVKKYTNTAGCSSDLPVVNISAPLNNAVYSSPATIELTATATVTKGTIAKVEFYNGTNKLGEDATSPFTYSWENVSKGTYSITAVATDNSGQKTTSSVVSVKVNVAQGAYNQIVHAIPGTIEAEEFDLGGNGVAYKDDTPGSSVTPAVNFRSDEDVDIETCTDTGGGYNIGYATSGEWLEYTVNVAATGSYRLDLRVACSGDGRKLFFTMDGVSIADSISIPNTAGWQTWQTASISNVPLTSGMHILRMTIGQTDYVNINFMTFSSVITGLDDKLTVNGLSIHPNPFESTILIDHEGDFKYKLHDISGRILLQGQAQGGTEVGATLQSGLYLLEIQTNTGSKLIKILKK